VIEQFSRFLPGWTRPPARKVLSYWHNFYDRSRSKWRGYRDSRKALRHATMIVQDVYNIRFVVYSWDRPNLPTLIRHSQDVAELTAMRLLVQPGDTALDVGANLGLYSILLSRLCGPTGHVWAFEPVPDTCWRLRESLALNRCENVTPVQAAVCEKSGTVLINVYEPRFAEWNMLGVAPPRSANGKMVRPCQSIDVPSLTLDEFCDTQRIERISFLKVDVEGFELSVFRGAERLLREHRVDYICFEFANELLKTAGVEGRRVFEELEAHGYLAYRFDKTAGKFQGPIQDSSEIWTNFFASWRDLSGLDEAGSGTQGAQRTAEKITVKSAQ